MKSVIVTVCLVLWAFPLMAETYSWIDNNGTVNFTEEYSNIPKKYRTKAVKRGDISMTPSLQQVPTDAASEKKISGRVMSTVENGATGLSSGSELFGGRKIEEWKRELDALENELKKLDSRTKEAEAERGAIARGGYSREDIQRQSEKLKAATDAYNEGVERYNQLLESAKKAGVPIAVKK
jgi:hypothetical protein